MRPFQERRDAILQYLQNHPDAGDTVEGIAQWWLAQQDVGESEVLVEQALNHLVKLGLLKRHVLVEGTILYELAPPTPPS